MIERVGRDYQLSILVSPDRRAEGLTKALKQAGLDPDAGDVQDCEVVFDFDAPNRASAIKVARYLVGESPLDLIEARLFDADQAEPVWVKSGPAR